MENTIWKCASLGCQSPIKNNLKSVEVMTYKTKNIQPVAIIGIGCRYPGESNNPAALWDNLISGKDCLSMVPPDRWDWRKFYDENPDKPGKISVNSGGFLNYSELTEFDPLAFGMSPREAETLDPQQRLLLQSTWEAIEDSGMTFSKLQKETTAVVVGGFHLENYLLQASYSNMYQISQHSPANVMMTMLSNKISYVFDLKGPSFSIDTACSSSLTALELAFSKIQQQECDIAICGGVNVMLFPTSMMILSKGHFLSDKSRAFSDHAKGYGRGEGAGIVILKNLKKALEDNDHVYAVIQNVGINHDGRTTGITFPNQYAQVELMKKVYQEASLSPSEINYIEAHGTGTTAGDKAETWSINEVFKTFKSRQTPILVGSVKTNIGHTEAAAGIAGVIKAALILKHRRVPASIHSQRLNPEIPFGEMCLEIPKENIDLPPNGELYAGINSFGYGGANAHALLCSPPPKVESIHPPQVPVELVSSGPYLCPVSAKSQESLRALLRNYASHINLFKPDLRDICHTLVNRRSFHEIRAVFNISNITDLTHLFNTWTPETRDPKVTFSRISARPPKILFVFTGVGPQWHAMGRELYQQYPVYKETIDECDRLIRKYTTWSLTEELSKSKETTRVNDTEIMQPALVSVQIALTRLWEAFGVRPDGIIGHSLGEISAAYATGAISIDDAIKIAVLRGEVLSKLEGRGSMMAVGLSESGVQPYFSEYLDKVSIAAINDNNSVTLSGDTSVLESIAETLERQEIFNRFLKVKVPFHSPVTSEILNEFISKLGKISGQLTHVKFYSSQFGRLIDGQEIDTSYWSGNIRNSVHFSQAFTRALMDGFDSFIEIGPHPVLKNSIDALLADTQKEGQKFPSLIRETCECETMFRTLSGLFVSGVAINWDVVSPPKGKYLKLPTYPWNKQTYWLESIESKEDRQGRRHAHVCLQKRLDAPGYQWVSEMNEQYFPFLKDHVVQGNIAFPGAGYVEAALAISQEIFGNFPVQLEGVTFDKMLIYNPIDVHPLHLDYSESTGQFNFSSKKINAGTEWMQYSKGNLVADYDCLPVSYFPVSETLKQFTQSKDPSELYGRFNKLGMHYGESFQTIKQYLHNENHDQAWVCIELNNPGSCEGFIIPPPLLDGAFQAVLNFVSTEQEDSFVPVKIGSLWVYQPWPVRVWACLKKKWQTSKAIDVDIQVVDDQGKILSTLVSCQFSQILSSQKSQEEKQIHYEIQSHELETDALSSGFIDIKSSLVIEGPRSCRELGNLAKWRLSVQDIPNELLSLLTTHVVPEIILDFNIFDQKLSEDSFTDLLDLCEHLVILSKVLLEYNQTIRLVLFENVNSKKISDNYFDLWSYSLYGYLKVLASELPHVRILYIPTEGTIETWFNKDRTLDSDETGNMMVFPGKGRLMTEKLAYRDSGEIASGMINTKSMSCVFAQHGSRVADAKYISTDIPNATSDGLLIQVQYAVVDEDDLLKITQKLSPFEIRNLASGNHLGKECVGKVISKGEGCNAVCEEGSFVTVAFGGNSLTPWLSTQSPYIFQAIPGLDISEACIFLPFITAYYGLINQAKLLKGETILIHDAASGTGLAAIQIARYVGAKIYATAAGETQRNYLQTLQIEAIFDMGSLNFTSELTHLTSGKNLDVIFSTRRNTQLRHHVRLLADFGRYVEVVRKLPLESANLPAQAYERLASIHMIDMDRMAKEFPHVIRELYVQIVDGFQKGIFSKIPVTIYPAAKIQDALSVIQQMEHVGRVVIDFKDQFIPVRKVLRGDLIHDNATYLITGGLSGFGLKVAEWMCEQGAKNLVLISRSGNRNHENNSILSAIEKRGVNLRIMSVDVSRDEDVGRMFENIQMTMPPVEGIIHSAMVLDDRSIFKMDREAFLKVLNPKILGALNLHKHTIGLSLKFFVNFSSVSSIIGNSGQSNYAVANSFLDAFAHVRRASGLPTTTINWGAIGDIGIVARNKDIEEKLVAGGVIPIPIKEALFSLGQILLEDKTHVGVIYMVWERWSEQNPLTASWPLFSKVVIPKKAGLSEEIIEKLLKEKQSFMQAEGKSESEFYVFLISREIAALLNINLDSISAEDTLNNIGIDSLMAVELSANLQKGYGLIVSSFEILNGITVKALGHKLKTLLEVHF